MMSLTVMLWAITSALPLPARAAALLLEAFFPGGVRGGLRVNPEHEVR